MESHRSTNQLGQTDLSARLARAKTNETPLLMSLAIKLFDPNFHLVLGSQSPRRRELLELIVPSDRISVRPPSHDRELKFDDTHDWESIDSRLRLNAQTKCRDVVSDIVQSADSIADHTIVLAADTIIVARDADDQLCVLEKPPEPDWQPTVRHWFESFLLGRSHWAATAFCMSMVGDDSKEICRIVRSTVTFRDDMHDLIDWYLSTDEPRGKAGGYGIQGAADVFVERVEGSVSNVVGLPLAEVFRELNRLVADVT